MRLEQMWIADKSQWWVLACFDINKSEAHQRLGEWITQFSTRTGAKVDWCGPHGTEIIGFPAKAAIVDRAFLGERIYDLFCDYCTEVNDAQPIEIDGEQCSVGVDIALICIDGNTTLPLPKLPVVIALDLQDARAMPLIVRAVELLRISDMQDA